MSKYITIVFNSTNTARPIIFPNSSPGLQKLPYVLSTDELHHQLLMCDAEFLFTASNLAETALQASGGTDVKVADFSLLTH